LQSLWDGVVAVEFNALLGSMGVAPLFAARGNGGEVVCAILGVIIVLAVGSIWRRRSLNSRPELAA
jgi:hypothetical protein